MSKTFKRIALCTYSLRLTFTYANKMLRLFASRNVVVFVVTASEPERQ